MYVTKEQRRRNFGFVLAFRLFRWDCWNVEHKPALKLVTVVAGPLLLSVNY